MDEWDITIDKLCVTSSNNKTLIKKFEHESYKIALILLHQLSYPKHKPTHTRIRRNKCEGILNAEKAEVARFLLTSTSIRNSICGWKYRYYIYVFLFFCHKK